MRREPEIPNRVYFIDLGEDARLERYCGPYASMIAARKVAGNFSKGPYKIVAYSLEGPASTSFWPLGGD